MGYAVELFFDAQSEQTIETLWKTLHDNNISRYMHESGSKPHITLDVYTDPLADPKTLTRAVERVAKTAQFFPLTLSNIGLFPGHEGVVFLAPKVTRQLLGIHELYHATASGLTDSTWSHYHPGLWTPHCTMTIDITRENVLAAIDLLADKFRPIDAMVERIGLVEFHPIRHLVTFDLQSISEPQP